MTATADPAPAIDAPGVYDGIPEADYHAHPALSASGAKLLLPPSCPARYHWQRTFGQPARPAFEFGTAAHRVVLGTGPELVIIDAPDWRTKSAQQARDAARFEGHVPLLISEMTQVHGMASALRAHPIAGPLLDPARGGKAEQSLFWECGDTGIFRRARLDWLPTPNPLRRMIITDYKTTTDASPAAVRKTIANLNYHMQAAWYIDACLGTGADDFTDTDEPSFLFVFQEKTEPYLVTVAELDEHALHAGRALNAEACEVWRDCTESGIWPGYTDYDIELISLPPWARGPGGNDLL